MMESDSAWLLLFGSIVCGAEFLATHRNGFDLGDEGYLWYGSQQRLAGLVPILHFRAYDPGRYFWVAAWFRLLGSGLIQLRFSLMIVKVLALLAATILLDKSGASLVVQSSALPGLIVWMRPRHKMIDHAMPVLGIVTLFMYLTEPGPTTVIAMGLTAGLSFVVGLNHGLYQTTGACLALLLSRGAVIQDPMLILWVGISLLVGASPLVLMALRYAGFAAAYWNRKIQPILRRKHANLPVPVPWPWRTFANNPIQRLGQLSQGVLFLGLPAAYCSVLLGSLIQGELAAPALLACACIGLPYAHHAFSRADVSHLAQSIHPLLLLLAVNAGTFAGVIIYTVFLILTSLMSGLPGWRVHFHLKRSDDAALVGGQTIGMNAGRASLVRVLRQLKTEQGWSEQSLWAIPNLAGVYPALGLRTPVYDTFPIYPGNAESQGEMLLELSRGIVRAILVNDVAIDGREDLRFERAYPDVWAWIQKHATALKIKDLPGCYTLWVVRPGLES